MDSRFQTLVQRFQILRPFVALTLMEKEYVRKTLDELHNIDYNNVVSISSKQSLLLVNQLCSIVPCDDILLCEQTALLILKLTKQRLLSIDGSTFLLTVKWCLTVLKYGVNVNVDSVTPFAIVLKALECIVRGNPASKNQRLAVFGFMEKYPSIYEYISLVDLPKYETLKVPLVCALEAIISIPTDIEEEYPEHILDQLLMFFVKQAITCKNVSSIIGIGKSKEEEITLHHILIQYSLSGARYALQINANLLDNDNPYMRYLLEMCQMYMVYDMQAVTCKLTQELYPQAYLILKTEQAPSTPPSSVLSRRKRRQINRNAEDRKIKADVIKSLQESNLLISNSSIPSGSTTLTIDLPGCVPADTKTNNSTIHLEALLLLYTLLKFIDKRTLYEYFTSFLKVNPVTGNLNSWLPSGNNLQTCMLKDFSPRCRLAAQMCLQVLLTDGKPLLVYANSDWDVPEAPPRCIMKDIIISLHHSLCYATNEPSPVVLTQVLKTMSMAVRQTSYESVNAGLCLKIVRNIKPIINHADSSVQVGALTVLGYLLGKRGKEIEAAFLQTIAEDRIPTDDDLEVPPDSTEVPPTIVTQEVAWIIQQCFNNLASENCVLAPVKIESLQIMGVLCERYFETLIYPYLQFAGRIMTSAFDVPSNSGVQHHATKAMELMGIAMSKHHELPGCLNEALHVWQTLLEGCLSTFPNSDYFVLRAGAADCIGAVGKHVFELLPRHLQVMCITVLLSLAVDPDTSVRSAAVRAIGMLLLFPSVYLYDGYLQDATDIFVKSMNDKSIAVRVRASWGLGNLSDTLVQRYMNPDFEKDANISDINLDPIICAVIAGCKDSDKIRCNAVRALGNLLQLLHTVDTEEKERAWLCEGVEALLTCSTKSNLMKARWNACYALGNVLKMPPVYTQNASDGVRLSLKIFAALSWIITECTNIKVRINAAMAVTSCKSRESYGENFISLWGSLVNGLLTVENIDDASEYQQRDKLVMQTCSTLAHMTRLANVEDLEMLADIVADGADNLLARQIRRVYDRLLPENNASLLEAEQNLQNFSMLSLTDSGRQALGMLIPIFRHELT